jgi:hypothetical protein
VSVNFDKAPDTYEPDFALRGYLVTSSSGTGEQGKVKDKLKLEAEEAVVVQLTGVERRCKDKVGTKWADFFIS